MWTETDFEPVKKLKVGIIGDFCLDVYWTADMKKSELSRETPHYPLPVIEERMSPGGAGNVAVNVSSLGVGAVYAIGCIGNDWRGKALSEQLALNGIHTEGLVTCDGRFTNTYIKPIRCGISDVKYEDPRLDFENYETINDETEESILQALLSLQDKIDILCVCDQMKYGCITDKLRQKISELGKSGRKIIVDSRDRISLYSNVTVKPNEVEAARAMGTDDLHSAVKRLSQKNQKPAIVTLGDKGSLVSDGAAVYEIPAFEVEPPIDFCGAGDTFMAAFGTFWASGFEPEKAALLANAASAVIIKKIGTTGSATIREILNVVNK